MGKKVKDFDACRSAGFVRKNVTRKIYLLNGDWVFGLEFCLTYYAHINVLSVILILVSLLGSYVQNKHIFR